MQTRAREVILIINAHHRHAFYNSSLARSVEAANKLGGAEYILVEAPFDTANGGEETLASVAQLTAAAIAQHQPSKVYQCVDYNEGKTGSPDSSIPALINCNLAAGITIPLFYIFDGANATARMRDENAYGQGDYRFIMKFIVGLKNGLQPAPSPSPTETPTAPRERPTSAPPASIGTGAKKIKKKVVATSSVSSQSTNEEGKQTTPLETPPPAQRAASAFTAVQTRTQLDLTNQQPMSQSPSLSSTSGQETPLIQVDITYNNNNANPEHPITVSLNPFEALSFSGQAATITDTPVPSVITIILPSPLPEFSGQQEYPDISITPPTTSGAKQVEVPHLFSNHLAHRRLHSPVPTKTALSPIISRNATPEACSNYSSPSSPAHFRAPSTEVLNFDNFLAVEHKESPNNSPLLGVRTLNPLNHGRNSPFRSPTQTPSPAGSPNRLFTRRLSLAGHSHFGDSSASKKAEAEAGTEANEKKTGLTQ